MRLSVEIRLKDSHTHLPNSSSGTCTQFCFKITLLCLIKSYDIGRKRYEDI